METVWERERAEGSHELRLSTLQNLRGVRMIVDAHLGKALSSLSDGERQTAIDMLDELVTPSGGKIAESVPDLAHRTGHSEDQAGSVLDKLDHERIVRPFPAAPGQDPVWFRRYEIFHDVLGSAINHMIAAREERRRARRLRRFAALAVGLLIVALAIVGVFAYLWHSATTAKLTAESRQLAADAEVNATRDPELSVLLALQALRLHYTSQAEDALRAVLPELQAVRTFREGTTVYSAVFDPVDANKVASADGYGVAWIWDVKTGHRLVRMSLGGFAITGAAFAVAFNPAGTEVAVGYANGKVALFDARSGRELRSANVFGSAGVNDVEFVGSTGELAIATEQGLALWQPQNRSRCCDILSHEQANTIAADPRHPLEFAVTTVNGTVIWNVSGSGKPRQQRLPQGPWSTNDAAFSPDGSEVVTADSYGNVKVYDLATFKAVMTLDAGEANAWRVAFSPHGKRIVAGYSSGRARVWDVSTKLQLTLLAGSASGVEAARFNADGSEVVTASDDGTIRVWHSQPRELQTEFASSSSGGTPNPIGGAGYISNSRILTLDGSGRLYVFTASGEQQAVISPGTAVVSAASNRAGTEIVTADSDGTVDLWHAIGSNYTQIPLPSPIHLNGPPLIVGMSPDGSHIAIVTPDYYTIQMRSTHTGQLLQTLSAVNAISVVAFSPSGRQILTGGINGQVEVWDAANGHRVLGTPGPSIRDIEFNKSGSEFVTASESGVVTIWAARHDRPLRSIDACLAPSRASFSPDGSKIVVACGDGSAPVFAAATRRQLTVLSAASAGTVSSAAFSPDGKTIVTAIDAGDAGGVQIWNSELATPSLRALERLAEQRLTRKLTAAERKEYLTGISG
jgi:WD40 repeat protein